MSQDTNPFIDIVVQPSHGSRKLLISWTVAQGFEDMKFYIFRSVNNGAPPWKAISTTPISGTSFEDDKYIVNNRMRKVFYRLVGIDDDGTEYKSPIISSYDKLKKGEFGHVQKMMYQEYLRMHSGNGLQAFHYLPLAEGEVNPAYDKETGQKLIADCPDDESYGLKYKGGYGPPVQTWIELNRIGPEQNNERADGQGSDTTYSVTARMLAFPKPMTNHLIVHPTTDNRYVVDSVVQPYLFKGLISIAYDVNLKLLRRSDPRYRVSVPALQDDPTWNEKRQND